MILQKSSKLLTSNACVAATPTAPVRFTVLAWLYKIAVVCYYAMYPLNPQTTSVEQLRLSSTGHNTYSRYIAPVLDVLSCKGLVERHTM